jgi:UDP-GlcNAc:undecaprenyl-phosphate GlcNAc-1-phosphate transferase
MDGLLGSVGLIACAALAGMAGLREAWDVAAVAVALAGALLGFLPYNFAPATIFLGDCGSMAIGLIVGTLAIQASLTGPATMALAAPAALLVLPIADTTAAILRRKLTGRSLYCSDRAHLHHCLLRGGLSKRQAVLLVAGLSLVAATGALVSVASVNEWPALAGAAFVVALLVATRLFGHAELLLLWQRIGGLTRSFLVRPPGRTGHAVAVRLQGSADWRKVWARLLEVAARLNIVSVRFDIHAPALHEGYHACWDLPGREREGEGLWRAEIPLTVREQVVGRLQIAGHHEGDDLAATIAAVARLVTEVEAAVSLVAAHDGAAAPARPEPRPMNGQMSKVPID